MRDINVSIIIATCNREAILWATVNKAVEAVKGRPAEIIIVNDGYIDLTIPEHLAKKITCLNNKKRGVSSARNLGASKAQGHLLFFIDDDMWINHAILDWINVYLVQKKETNAVYNINWIYPPTLTEKLGNYKIGNYILSTGYNTMWGRMHEKGQLPNKGRYRFNAIGSCSLLLSKELFDKIGKYNESISFQGEDIDLASRINRLSIPIYCVFDVTLYHNHEDRLSINEFIYRVKKGYQSQFIAEKKMLIPLSENNYSRPKIYLFNFSLLTEKIWINIYKLLPNNKLFEPFVNKLIGLLAGLEKYKQWKKVFTKSDIKMTR